MAERAATLGVYGVSVSFGGIAALSEVDLEIAPGTVHGLIGPNGAGKTTLFNVVSGLQAPQRGSVSYGGRDITRFAPHHRARLGIARTFQRLELFGTLTARENVLMAAETQRRRLWLGKTAEALADALLDRLGLRGIADEPTDTLPTGTARMVELARALATSPTMVLLDEPSAGLNDDETTDLGRTLGQLAEAGIGVLLVEHDMTLVMGICQHITVLDFGVVVARGDPAAIRGDPTVQAAYLGTEPDRTRTAEPVVRARTPTGAAAASALLELQAVRAGYGRIEVLHDVSLQVPQGSVLALLGPNGAGKSTLLKVASGRLPVSSGIISYEGRSIQGTLPEQLAHRGLCAVPEGRSIFPNLTVAENLLMWTYAGTKLEEVESVTFARFPALAGRRAQVAGTLSGGEQQMLALARVLVRTPRLLLLDELSMGLAPLVMAELYDIVQSLADEGVTVVLAEQFVHAALSVATVAAIVVGGRIERTGDPEEIGAVALDSYLASAISSDFGR